MKVGALILAAGFSTRFGEIKLLAKLHSGRTVFEETEQRIAAAVSEHMVVTRPELADSLAALTSHLAVFDDASKGMGATLAHGIGFATSWDACLVCLADMPFIPTSTYQQIASATQAKRIVIPHFADQPGNPVAFGSHFYPALAALDGDAGGKQIMQQNQDAIVKIAVTDDGILKDIDTPADLARLQS